MHWKSIAAAIILASPASVFAQSAGASAATPPPAPCSDAAYRALDFWVGDWAAAWDANGQKGTGTNRIRRDEFGNCAITERFTIDDGSFSGFSVSTYRPPQKHWRQTWVDDQGGYFDLEGGPQADGRFVLENRRPSEAAPFLRMVFEDISADAFTWRWQGRPAADQEWQDRWVIRYTRKPRTP